MAVTTVFSETKFDEFMYYSHYGMYGTEILGTLNLSVGDKCTIEWDSVTYECIVQDASSVLEGFLAFGNLTDFELNGNDEPFLVGFSDMYTLFFSLTDKEARSHTIAIYTGEVDGIVIKNPRGQTVTYGEYKKILLNRASGEKTIYSEGEAIETTVALSFDKGDMAVVPSDGKLFSKVNITQPSTLVAQNIRKGVNVAGVVGDLTIKTEEELDVSLNFKNGDMEIVSGEGKTFSKVNIPQPSTLLPENIAEGIEIGGITGEFVGGVKDIGTETEMNALLISKNVGNVYRFVGETTNNYINGDIYVVEEVE